MVTGMRITQSELHALRSQFVADLPDQLRGSGRIIRQLPGSHSITAGQRSQKCRRGITGVAAKDPTAHQQRRHQGKSDRQGRQASGYRTLSTHGREYAPSRFLERRS